MEVTLIKSELFKSGGLEKYTWQIARDFCALNIPVTLLTSGEVNPPFQDPLLNIVSLPVSHCLTVLNVIHFDRACSAYLKQHKTPIIFSLDRNRFQTHIRAGNGVHAAYLQQRSKEEGRAKQMSFALNPLHHTILALEKKAFEHKGLKLLFTNSLMVKEEILDFYDIPPEKIVPIHNGVEWHAMRKAFELWESEKESLLRQFNLDPTAFQFLFIGHNFRRKGLEKLLRALSCIRSEHFQLNIIGKDKETKRFRQLAKDLDLEDKAVFWGPRKDTSSFYQIADTLVIPSLYDPFANVTLEALAMGVPVVSSKHNGGREILTPINGSIIESLEDSRVFAQVLREALARPKNRSSAQIIRESVRHLDFSSQLRLMTKATLESIDIM